MKEAGAESSWTPLAELTAPAAPQNARPRSLREDTSLEGKQGNSPGRPTPEFARGLSGASFGEPPPEPLKSPHAPGGL